MAVQRYGNPTVLQFVGCFDNLATVVGHVTKTNHVAAQCISHDNAPRKRNEIFLFYPTSKRHAIFEMKSRAEATNSGASESPRCHRLLENP
ncbi:hypothetical protein BDI4_180003 [Burkholderia diffusa]|nr:hypothetical protein BDI4_180003 [Burkholderia diffusa]